MFAIGHDQLWSYLIKKKSIEESISLELIYLELLRDAANFATNSTAVRNSLLIISLLAVSVKINSHLNGASIAMGYESSVWRFGRQHLVWSQRRNWNNKDFYFEASADVDSFARRLFSSKGTWRFRLFYIGKMQEDTLCVFPKDSAGDSCWILVRNQIGRNNL